MSTQGQHGRMLDGVIGKHGDIGGAAAKIHQRHADFAFFLSKDSLGRSQGLKGDIRHLKLAAVAGTHDVLRRRHRPGDNVNLYFKAHAGHA